ncbi:MAG: hypothetical protein GY780_05680 [bacterium]|nr:hypothetical protein [bacterium]
MYYACLQLSQFGNKKCIKGQGIMIICNKFITKSLSTLLLISFLTSCSVYHPTPYTHAPSGAIIARDKNGNSFQESELIGKECKIWTSESAFHEGKIIKFTKDSVYLEVSFDYDFSQAIKPYSKLVKKSDITKMEIKFPSKGRTVFFVTVGVLTIVYIKTIIFFLAVLIGGSPYQ